LSRRPDVPSTVSRQAQDYLRTHRAARLPIPLWPWVAKAARRRRMRVSRPIVERLASTLGVHHSATEVGGVSCVEFRATDIVDERAVLHIHGGAYFLGQAFDITAVQLAAALRRPVLSIEYTTVPDATVPTPINECMAVYRRVAEHHAPYALSGVSAGGGLVLAMYHAIQSQQLPEPERVLLFTPAADLTGEGDSYRSNEGRDPLIAWKRQLDKAVAAYSAGVDPRDPRLSPINTAYTRPLAPTLIITGTRDLFLSNCVRTYWKLRDLAGTVELRIWEGMWHAFFGEPDLPETVRCFNEVATFCRD
jgi:epsilon-lactone hydrolase